MAVTSSARRESATRERPATLAPPRPLVSRQGHFGKWLLIKVALIIAALVFAHFGTLIIAAVYYILFEVIPWMTAHWHALVPNGTLRHNIRDVSEGLLGGIMAQAVVYNYYSPRRLKHPKPVRRVTGWLIIPLALATLVCAVPGFIIGFRYSADVVRWIASVLHHAGLHLRIPARVPLWAKAEKALAAQNWDYKLTGFFASVFLARWPGRMLFNQLQAWFVERRYASGSRNAPWYYLPNQRARFNATAADPPAGVVNADHGTIGRVFVGMALTGVAFLIVYGWYVLTYIAK
jgi:hypothetical protein